MYADNELLFPPQAIQHVRTSRGEEWGELVERISRLPQDHPEVLAFSLLMIRLDGCLTCETDSYRAMRGCVSCARQTLRRYKGSDKELLREYNKSIVEVENYLDMHALSPMVEEPLSARAA
jgi:hypothetical protein